MLQPEEDHTVQRPKIYLNRIIGAYLCIMKEIEFEYSGYLSIIAGKTAPVPRSIERLLEIR